MRVNFKTKLPQVSRVENSKSHISKLVSPMEKEGQNHLQRKLISTNLVTLNTNLTGKRGKKGTITIGTSNIQGLRHKTKINSEGNRKAEDRYCGINRDEKERNGRRNNRQLLPHLEWGF